ncbi:DUF6691 family protein [Sphingomonas sp. 37zxx]|uniref:DUF6691 family protein n=1 Tax=Sphingomonas sp. 37zxx TaxID=1550073 RepID=UPI00068DA5E2|nr:DUF6691 family protein [Sphingomonas sp. 37zxx]
MNRTLISLIAGMLFGAGLAVSGMLDPVRVRGFLDLFGRWDPTLAFVMGGAMIPMALAWLVQRRMATPIAEAAFHLPDTDPVTPRLLGGSAMFGIGWALGGLCPGPALAALAINPLAAMVFIVAMIAGFILVTKIDALPQPAIADAR